MASYLENDNLLTAAQNGFRSKHSTIQTIFDYLSDLTNAYNNNLDTLAVYIDFKMAFDTANHTISLDKLKTFNFDVNSCKLFKSYLTNRIQATFINGRRCGIQYVGQTKRELKMRLSEHFLKITRNDPENEIASHYNSEHHSGLDDISFYVVDFVHAAPHTLRSKQLRDLIEFNWIQRLHTNAPSGLNVMDLLRS